MTDDLREVLAEPKNRFQQTMRDLAEAAMSVCNHDAAEHEPGYIHDVQTMERRFSRILKGKMKPMRSSALAAPALIRDTKGEG